MVLRMCSRSPRLCRQGCRAIGQIDCAYRVARGDVRAAHHPVDPGRVVLTIGAAQHLATRRMKGGRLMRIGRSKRLPTQPGICRLRYPPLRVAFRFAALEYRRSSHPRQSGRS
jgi:hypothetical protein